MKIIKPLLIFLFIGFSATAQNIPTRIFVSGNQGKILMVNNEIIGSMDLLRNIPKDQIGEMNMLQEKQLSTKENLFHNGRNTKGIMEIKTGFDFSTKTQEEINRFFGLDPSNDLYINGFLIENKKYKISSESIASIEIIEPNDVFLRKKVINITMK